MTTNLVIAVALFVLCGLVGAAAQTGGQTDVPVNQVVPTSCQTGEPIQVTGNIHFAYTVTTDSITLINTYSVMGAAIASGVGQATQSQYSGNTDYSTAFATTDSPSRFTVTLSYALASQGPAPSLVLVQAMNVSVDNQGSISVSLTSASTQCVGQ